MTKTIEVWDDILYDLQNYCEMKIKQYEEAYENECNNIDPYPVGSINWDTYYLHKIESFKALYAELIIANINK